MTGSSTSLIEADEALLELLGLLDEFDCERNDVSTNADASNNGDTQQWSKRKKLENILTVEEDQQVHEIRGHTSCSLPTVVSSSELLRQLLSLKARVSRPLRAIPINHLLPRHCSRHQITPSHSFALSIKKFLSSDECQALIQLSHRSNPKYITEASHVAPDGTHYTVPIQNPNPHKLAVIEQRDIIHGIWARLCPLLTGKVLNESSESSIHNGALSEGRKRWGSCRGLNPRIRILRYDATDGDLFEPHFDATTVVGRHTSAWTVLIYLNGSFDDCTETLNQSVSAGDLSDSGKNTNILSFEGGETCFLNQGTFATAKKVADNLAVYKKGSEGGSTLPLNDFYCIRPETGQAVVFEHDLFHTGLPLIRGTKYVLRTDVLFDTKVLETVAESKYMEEECSDDESHVPLSDNLSTFSADTSETKDSTGTSNIQTVADVCRCLNVSEEEQDILHSIDLLNVSLHTFLVPKAEVLKALLCESGLLQSTVKDLVQQARERISKGT